MVQYRNLSATAVSTNSNQLCAARFRASSVKRSVVTLLGFVVLWFSGHAQDFDDPVATTAGNPATIQSIPFAHSTAIPYARSFQDDEGGIHLQGGFKVVVHRDEIVVQNEPILSLASIAPNDGGLNVFFSRKGLFLGLAVKVSPTADGIYAVPMMRSFDSLRTSREEQAIVDIPEAGKVDFGDADHWSGLFFHRSIVELLDGSLLATMNGNFESDKVVPTNSQSQLEEKYKARAFAVRSVDGGKTWRYLSSLAVPEPGRIDDGEGFNEWTVLRLDDGRLLGIIRTGHFTPLVACWSADEGRTWTVPRSPHGLGPAGVDPCLLKLSDGRLALAFGEMVQPKVHPERHWWSRFFPRQIDSRRRCRLAICTDRSGENWTTINVSDFGDRTAYSTVFEIAPSTLLYQTDLELWKIHLSVP